MLTDSPPRKANRSAFAESDRMKTLDLPLDRALLTITKSLEWAMKAEMTLDVRRVCVEFLHAASKLFAKVDAQSITIATAATEQVGNEGIIFRCGVALSGSLLHRRNYCAALCLCFPICGNAWALLREIRAV